MQPQDGEVAAGAEAGGGHVRNAVAVQEDSLAGGRDVGGHSLQTLPGCPALPPPTAPTPGLSASDTARPAHVCASVIPISTCVYSILGVISFLDTKKDDAGHKHTATQTQPVAFASLGGFS